MKKQVDLWLLGSDCAAFGDKRCNDELGEKQESVRKRGKCRDLHSALSSEETNTFQASDKFQLGGEISQLSNVPVTFNLVASQVERTGRAVEVNRPPDLNTDVCAAYCASNSSPECARQKYVRKNYDKCVNSIGIGLDLNAEDVSSSVHRDSFYSSKKDDHLKSKRDALECGSTTGPSEEKDPLRVWKEMKENGFFSSSSSRGGVSIQSSLISSVHGGIPMPKQRGRVSKSDVLKKKMELAKKEQVDRFTKIAAPSGLLNGLNPGIINHVRNKKQVHSIIEALVRSEKHDHSGETKQEKHQLIDTKQTCNASDSGIHQISCSQGSGVSAVVSGSKQIVGCHMLSRERLFSTEDYSSSQNFVSHSTAVTDSNTLALKLSSTKEDSGAYYSSEESANSNFSLSVKAASVASQWLELLHQDIKGRLSALQRSRKRVRAVITTELPFLISKEFTSNHENDPCMLKNLCDGQSSGVMCAMHQTRWSTLFDQMDKALSEEEKQLENCLNKVKEMQLHCDQGLQGLQWSTFFGFLNQETTENCPRVGKADSSEKDLAVRAAAASIYSTCNFLMSKENVSCF